MKNGRKDERLWENVANNSVALLPLFIHGLYWLVAIPVPQERNCAKVRSQPGTAGWAIFSTQKLFWNIDPKCCWHDILQILRHHIKNWVLKLEAVQLGESGVFVLLGCVRDLSAQCYFCCHSGQNNWGRSSSKLWCWEDSSRMCRVLPLHPRFRRWSKNSSKCHILVKPSSKTSWFLYRF